MMKVEGHMERLLLLPFTLGCDSHSTIAVHSMPKPGRNGGEERDKLASKTKMTKKKKNWKALLSQGFHRFREHIKSFSQLFVYKDKDDLEKETEIGDEKEMEIGFPTNVKHLTHIGWDGSCTTVNNTSSANHHQMLSTVSFQQFQLAMAAQSQSQPQSYSHLPLPLKTAHA